MANLEIFEKERTLEKLNKKIKFLEGLLQDMKKEALVGDIRQCGFMVGIELVKDTKIKKPFPPTERMGYQVAKECEKRGLLIRPIGNVLVLLPPLSVTTKELKEMVKTLQRSIREMY
ncbi:MAG: hypothetical protein NPIRA04_18480 [Nitrospirales bacterium]|nr:MAG: hypothetical protein NPIRA04_18480 [Nitrospirales bacterium]